MSDNALWWSEIEAKYRNYFSARLKKSLPDYTFNIPTERQNSTPSEFPTIYFNEVSQSETGNNLANDGVNAVIETIEIQVITNDTLAENKDITATCALLMKQFRFNMIMSPVYLQEGGDIRKSVARFRRIIGCDDGVF